MPNPELLGPLGLTIAALIVVGVLWKLVREYIAHLRTNGDGWRAVAESQATKLDEQTEALSILPSMAATLERIERRMDAR